jgi:DNA topoisomerase IB
MRLRRARIEGPGIARRRRGRGFTYVDASGNAVRDPEILARIDALAIPPAWNDVWICPDANGHIQAVGTDAAGRRQYRYHDAWRSRRDAMKFDRMIAFARTLPSLRERVAQDLRQPDLTRTKALACAVRLLDQAFFRVGSEVYARQNGSFGLATLRKEHVTVHEHVAVFDFTAKSGKRRVLEITDAELLQPIGEMKRRQRGGRELLAYRDGERWRDIRSADINAYLREATAGEFTAKDFRTWHGTVLAAVFLATRDTERTSVTSSRRAITAAVKDVASYLGNTPAVARASYIDPRVVERFEQGITIAPTLERLKTDDPTDPVFREAVEAAVLDVLEEAEAAAKAA